MEKNTGREEQNRRRILQYLSTAGVLSGGIAGFSSTGTAANKKDKKDKSNNGGSDGDDEPPIDKEGGQLNSGYGGSSEDFDTATAEAESRDTETSYDYSAMEAPVTDTTAFNTTESAFGTDITIDTDAAYSGYKYCNGGYISMVYAQISITVEDSGGVASYSQWAGISEDGCYYIGDSNGCIRVTNVVCEANKFAENPDVYIDEIFSMAEAAYDRAADSSAIDTVGAALYVLLVIVAFFIISLLSAATTAG